MKTKEKFENEIKNINEKELKSAKYWNTYLYLKNNYWNRKNIELENDLFKLIGINGLEKDMINESTSIVKEVRLKKYNILNQFINSLSEDQINSNLFLKTAEIFIRTSNKDCKDIINKANKFNNKNLISI